MSRLCARVYACGIVIAAVSMMSCASAGERVYVAPSNETVTAYLEASYDARSHHIMVQNSSTEEITVTSVTLSSCENIKNPCEVERMRLRVRPGARARLATVQAANPNRAFNFRWNWSWESSATPPVIPR